MELNGIKKMLYIKKPMAIMYGADAEKGTYKYQALVEGTRVMFEIPISEMGDPGFAIEEPAQLLIRWLVGAELGHPMKAEDSQDNKCHCSSPFSDCQHAMEAPHGDKWYCKKSI